MAVKTDLLKISKQNSRLKNEKNLFQPTAILLHTRIIKRASLEEKTLYSFLPSFYLSIFTSREQHSTCVECRSPH